MKSQPWIAAAKRVPLDVKVERETDCGEFVRREITYAAEPGARVPAYLLIPKDVLAGRAVRPGILALMPTNNVEGNRPVVGLATDNTKPNRNTNTYNIINSIYDTYPNSNTKSNKSIKRLQKNESLVIYM